jgi:hypothetical protein
MAGRSKARGQHELQVSAGGVDAAEAIDTQRRHRRAGPDAGHDVMGPAETADSSAGKMSQSLIGRAASFVTFCEMETILMLVAGCRCIIG